MVKCRDSCNLKVGREWQEHLVNLHEIKVSPVVELTSGHMESNSEALELSLVEQLV